MKCAKWLQTYGWIHYIHYFKLTHPIFNSRQVKKDDPNNLPAPSFSLVNQKPSVAAAAGKGAFKPNQHIINLPDEFWPPLVEYYGLTDECPLHQIKARNDTLKAMMFFTKEVCEEVVNKDVMGKLNLVHCGTKIIEKSNNKNVVQQYRLSHEGIHLVAPYLTKRKFVVGKMDFSIMLNFIGILNPKAFSEKLQEELKTVDQGSVYCALEGVGTENNMILNFWMSADTSLNSMVAQVEIDSMRERMRSGGWLCEVEEGIKKLVDDYAEEKRVIQDKIRAEKKEKEEKEKKEEEKEEKEKEEKEEKMIENSLISSN